MARNQVKLNKARVHVHASFNNTILTLTDTDGDVISWVTPGAVGFKGSRKGTPYAAQVAAENLVEELRDYGVNSVIVTVKGTGSGRNSVIQTIEGAGIEVTKVTNITPRAHS